jgi:hypothetical protein
MTWKAWHGPRLLAHGSAIVALTIALTGCSTTMQFPMTGSTVSYQ